MIRLILVAIYLILFLVLGIPALLVLWLIGKSDPGRKDRAAKAIVGWGFRCIAFLAGTKLIVRGTENIPADSAVLYVGNHRSYFDIVLTYSHFPGITGYVAKKEMLRWVLLKDWMKAIHCLFLDRDNIKEGLKTILKGVEEVKSGTSLCIFPEGTRNRTEDTFLEFHNGSFKVAEKTGCAIVPMSINNAGHIFEDHIPWIRKTHVVLEYCKPIYMNELDKSDRRRIGALVQDVIKEAYFKNKELV